MTCEYCKHNEIDRKEFKKLLWEGKKKILCLLDFISVGTYINENELVSIFFDDEDGIEQDSIKIKCYPVCKAELNYKKKGR